MGLFKEKHPSGYIIIGGCGRLGASLAARLSLKKRGVVAMDRQEEAFRRLASSCNSQTMYADINDIGRLGDAGIRKADVFTAATDRDNVNITAAQIAGQLYSIRRMMIRIYGAEKLKLLEGPGIEYLYPTELSEKKINRFMDWED